jgi:probable phosphoglycerate mutase
MILVRHGEAAGDEDTDPGLSEVGRSHVSALAGRLAGEGVESVWHGPKRRARETADILASRLGASLWSTELLDDRTPVPSARHRDDFSRRRLDWFDGVPEDERDEDGAALAAAWTQLRARPRSGPVVIVTHSFVIAEFVALAVGGGASSWMRFAVSPAGLTVLDEDSEGGMILRVFNETAHTRGDPDKDRGADV